MIGSYPIGERPSGSTEASAGTTPSGSVIDATKVPTDRRVVFEGSIRVVTFEGNIRKVVF